jgi:ATP-binding protein involved in chromosome partitioning
MLNEDSIREALASVKYPGFSRDIVSFGIVKEIRVAQGAVNVQITLTSASTDAAAEIKTNAESAIKSLDGVNHAFVEVSQPAGGAPAQSQAAGTQKPSGLGKIIAVASGKGGVGKSTTAVNLACTLKALGYRVGLLDCDIYGPSVPLMMGIDSKPTLDRDEKIIPLERHGVKLMSMGFLLDGDAPVIWRGPMITKTIHQFFQSVAWGDLDYLLVYLPPGTGDAQLSHCQTVPLDGGVIVTTPQEASLGVVRKGIGMFEKVNVPILGIVENMSYLTTSSGERMEIFGHGGGRNEAETKGVTFLVEVPIFIEIREGGDRGEPVVVSHADTAPGQAFADITKKLIETLNSAD